MKSIFADHGDYRYSFAKFQLALYGNYTSNEYSRTIPTFLTLYIFAFIYQLILVWDALRLKNTIQVIGLCIFEGPLLIYAAIQLDQIKDAVNNLGGFIHMDVWTMTRPYLVAIPCIIALFGCAMSAIAWKLYDEFAWTIYKHISADLRMKRRYLTFQVFRTFEDFSEAYSCQASRSISPSSSSTSSSSLALPSNSSSLS